MQVKFVDAGSPEQALRQLRDLAQQGSIHPTVREAAIAIVSGCDAREDICEIESIFRAVKQGTPHVRGLKRGLRYVADPRYADFFQAPQRTLELCARGACAGDCVPNDTLVLAGGYQLKPISVISVGDAIMGDGAWTRVTNVWDKGMQSVLGFTLDNGCTLRCTAGHKVFRVPKAAGLSPAKRRELSEEVFAGDLKVGEELLTPDTIPLDKEGVWKRGGHPEGRPFARIKSISELPAVRTTDIETESHRFYLPESDLVVHNCDDSTILVMSLLAALGFRVGARAWGKRKDEPTHVYTVVQVPKRNPTHEISLDTTVPSSKVGWHPPNGYTLTAWIR